MALKNQQSNAVSRLQQQAELVISLAQTVQNELDHWVDEGFAATINNADLDLVPTFSHLTKAKLLAAQTALTELETALKLVPGGGSSILSRLRALRG
jgi:hypothetical protein